MVTNKNNFRALLRRKYPETNVRTIFGYPIYLLDKPLDEYDQREYYNCQVGDLWFVTLEADETQATKLLDLYTSGLLNSRLVCNGIRDRNKLPTSNNAFEQWLLRHSITPLHKEHKHMSATAALVSDTVLNPDHLNWMFYELDNKDKYFTEHLCSSVPHIARGDKMYVLMRTSRSTYISKKQQLLNRPVKTIQATSDAFTDAFDEEDF